MNASADKSPTVRLKGVGQQLWLTLAADHPAERIIAEVEALFDRMPKLAVNSRVVIDAEGSPPAHLLADLKRLLEEKYRVAEVGPPDSAGTPPPPSGETRRRRRDMDRSWHHYRSDALVLAGRVRAGQRVSARNHLVILGDVNPGADVEAGGDIIVLGRLCGKALAGAPDNHEAIVMALDFQPTLLQIGTVVAAGMTAGEQNGTEFAHVEEGAIVVENYLKSNPFKRIQWPQVR